MIVLEIPTDTDTCITFDMLGGTGLKSMMNRPTIKQRVPLRSSS